jgi:hypothetical protein
MRNRRQALARRHRGQPPGPGRTRGVEFEYRRGGTLAYFAAYDVHHARVLGQIATKTGIEPFEKLVAQIMTIEPYAAARRVFWSSTMARRTTVHARSNACRPRGRPRHWCTYRCTPPGSTRYWSKVKQYRRVATRCDKTDICYLGFVHLAPTYERIFMVEVLQYVPFAHVIERVWSRV